MTQNLSNQPDPDPDPEATKPQPPNSDPSADVEAEECDIRSPTSSSEVSEGSVAATTPSDDETTLEDHGSHEEIGEDDPNLLPANARSLENEEENSENESSVDTPPPNLLAQKDDESDAGDIQEIDESTDLETVDRYGTVQHSAREVALELKGIEKEVRSLLENGDTRRKRKLAGTRRWMELQEDIISWRYSGRMDETVLCRLHNLVQQRHYLFHQLRYYASTRPVWNS